jgi:hypothetical protein
MQHICWTIMHDYQHSARPSFRRPKSLFIDVFFLILSLILFPAWLYTWLIFSPGDFLLTPFYKYVLFVTVRILISSCIIENNLSEWKIPPSYMSLIRYQDINNCHTFFFLSSTSSIIKGHTKKAVCYYSMYMLIIMLIAAPLLIRQTTPRQWKYYL